MKKYYFLFVLISALGFSQKKTDSDRKKIVKELAGNACKCVDSIKLMNRQKEDITKDIGSCIDKQAGALQVANLLFDSEELAKNAKVEKGKKQVTVSYDPDPKSQQYIDSYNALENYLLQNCESVKRAVKASDTKDAMFSDNEMAIDFYKKGEKEYKNKNFKEAVKYYELSLKKDKTFTYAWDNLGLSYRQLGDYDNAINAYKSSLMIDPKGKLPLQNIPVAYIYKKEYQKAIDSYLELEKIYPGDPEVYYGIGNIYTTALNDDEKGLDYACKAYRVYSEQKSPYRVDAENLIRIISKRMKENGKEDKFKEILTKNNFSF